MLWQRWRRWMAAAVVVGLSSSCGGDRPPEPDPRKSREFVDVNSTVVGGAVEVISVGYRPREQATVWELNLRCQDAEGCSGRVRATIAYAGAGVANNATLTGVIDASADDVVVISRSEWGTVRVSEITSVDVRIEPMVAHGPRRRE